MIGLLARSAQALRAEGFVAVCSAASVPGLSGLRVEVGGRAVLVCRTRLRIVAVSAICPHRGFPMDGATVEAGQVICPHHRYAFDLASGACVTRADCAPLDALEAEVGDDGMVYVRT